MAKDKSSLNSLSVLDQDSLVEELAASAVDRRLTLEEVQEKFQDRIETALAARPRAESANADEEQAQIAAEVALESKVAQLIADMDIAPILEKLMARGIDVVDESVEVATVEEDLSYLENQAGQDLDVLSLYRRDVVHHRVLSREEETEKTTRYAFLAKTVKALSTSETRLTNKIAELDLRAAPLRELIELITSEPEYDKSSIAGQLAEMAEIEDARAKLVADRERVIAERQSADVQAHLVEEDFLKYNYRLVMSCARRNHQQSGRRVDPNDLIQQGNMGMVEAFRKFDPTRGYKFSTFATWHIRQKISEFSHEQKSAIRVPTHRHRDIRKINAYRREFFEEHGENPSTDEIAVHLGRTAKKIIEILAAETIASPFSLDRPLGPDDESATMNDFIPDTITLTPEQSAIRAAIASTLGRAFLRDLSPRERRVLQLRFSLYDEGKGWTLEEVGKRLGVTRERVRQIEAKALQKLSVDPEIRELDGREPIEVRRRRGYRPVLPATKIG